MSHESRTSEEVFLKADEICNIIRQCALSNVAQFNFGELSITFHAPATEIAEPNPFFTTTDTIPDTPTQSSRSESDLSHSSPEDLPEDDELLVITDPLAYEKKQLEDEENETIRHSEAQ